MNGDTEDPPTQVQITDTVFPRRGAGLTDVGRRRSGNEDALFFDDIEGLYVVADGMGGHAAGEIASQEAVDTVRGMVGQGAAQIRAVRDGDHTPDAIRKVERLLESAVQAAAYMVFGLAQSDPDQQGMGTTVSALLLLDRFGVTAQVGDSRVYMVRGGRAHQLTEDHTLVAWQLQQGAISAAEAEVSPHRNVITRAVGSKEYVQVDTHFFETQSGDCYLVCSDGLHGYLEDDEIPVVLKDAPDLAVRRFVDMANARGGRDNITAVAVQVLAPEDSGS